MRKCFVISPIGVEGSKIRKHADDIFDFIIEPAMKECGILAVRSDRILEPGRISESMFSELLNDDLCVAILTGANPNVYYELAIAQAVGRPVIILLEAGASLPFDIQDLRCVYYDLDARSLIDGKYKKEVVEHIRSLEKNGYKGFPPWGRQSDIVWQSFHNITIYKNATQFGSRHTWLEALLNANNSINLMGISLNSWKKTQNFAKLLKEKSKQDCSIRIMIMQKGNPCLSHLVYNEEDPEGKSFDTILSEIDDMYVYFTSLAEEYPNIEFRQIFHGVPHCNITLTDEVAITIPYYISLHPRDSPHYVFGKNSEYYIHIQREFDSIWHANSPANIIGRIFPQ
ncbi:MAG: hypothetical protein LUQ31_11230 [Methanoregula sp.]|nr:hypothetical protein [Methanoregula sp.]